MKKVFVDEIKARAGTKVFGALKVGELPDSSEVLVPVIIIRGEKDGPTLTITAGVHGDEVVGIEACYKLSHSIKPVELKGTLVLVPICNPLAYNSRRRTTPMDGLDMNRCFPGKKDDSITYQMAYALFESVITRTNYLIDLHSGSSDFRLAPHVRTNPDSVDAINMAKSFNLGRIILRRGILTLNASARRIGVPSVCVEVGEGNRMDEEHANLVVSGVINCMKYLKMLKGKPVLKRGQVLLNERVYVRSPAGGLLIPARAEGERVEKGDVIAEVHNLYSGNCTSIRAPTNGFVIGVRKSPQVFTGQGAILIYR